MVEFLNKEFFVLLVPLFAVLILFLKFADRKKSEFYLIFFVSVLTVFILAEPVLKKGEQTIYLTDMDVVILIDRSLSMGVSDIKPSRLETAQKKVKQLLQMLDYPRTGVATFSDDVEVLLYPGEEIKKLQIRLQPGGSTDFINAFSTANSIMTGSQRVIILVSDGGDEDLTKLEELISQTGLKLVFYGIGTAEGGKVPGYNAVSRLNQQMVDLAKKYGIFVSYSEDSSDIKKIKDYIKSVMKKSSSDVIKIKSQEYLSPFIALFSIVMVGIFYLLRRFILLSVFMILLNSPALAGDFMGYIYYFSGYYEKAAVEFKKEKDPKSMYNAALSYYRAKMYENAEKTLKKIKTDEINLKKKVMYTLALCYLAQKKYKQAYNLTKKLLEIFPQENHIRKLYRFTNLIVSMEEKEKEKVTVVKIKEKRSKSFKTSPIEVGEKNPW